MPGQKLYLDQCMVSNLSNQGMPWQATRGGAALVAAQRRGVVEVWVSPMQVLETFLCADFDEHQRITETPKLDLRQSIAITHLHLAEATRMSQSYEFIMIDYFLRMLEELAPGVVRTRRWFDFLDLKNRQVYLGMLGLLASYRNLDRPDAVVDMLRNKITSRLLHSRFARSPRDYMDDLIAAAREFRVTRDDIYAEFDSRPLSDLTREIEENESHVAKLDGGTKQKLQRERESVAKSYGAVELGECMRAVFDEPLFLDYTFDISKVRDNWATIIGNPDARTPAFLAEANDDQCLDDFDLMIKTLELLFKAVALNRLTLPKISYKLVLGELELAIQQGEIPSGGLAFDSQHVTMLSRVDAFATIDGRFATLANRAASELAEKGIRVQVIVGMDELVRYLENL